mmetsp:Transcript_11880/g.24064  ORF Transcript_11880/g.24064 Transcript_11880/m.24064 type:complete len:210 (-) Transcript_11880:9-638(-)
MASTAASVAGAIVSPICAPALLNMTVPFSRDSRTSLKFKRASSNEDPRIVPTGLIFQPLALFVVPCPASRNSPSTAALRSSVENFRSHCLFWCKGPTLRAPFAFDDATMWFRTCWKMPCVLAKVEEAVNISLHREDDASRFSEGAEGGGGDGALSRTQSLVGGSSALGGGKRRKGEAKGRTNSSFTKDCMGTSEVGAPTGRARVEAWVG